MKKLILTIAIVLGIGLCSMAQNNGGLFERGETTDSYNRGGSTPLLPASHGLENDQPATPIGSGMLVLSALGAAYLVSKKRKGE